MSVVSFEKRLEQLINSESMENGCDTPDYILAAYMRGCLENFNRTVIERERWYGREAGGGAGIDCKPPHETRNY